MSNVLANQNKSVYILFTVISEAVFYNRCTPCGLIEPKHSENETKQVPFLSIPMSILNFFLYPHKEIIFLL